MDDARAPNYKLAEKDYMEGMKYKDIATKYKVTINTVKSWKQRYDWNKKGVHTKDKKVCTQKGGQPGNKNAVGHGAPEGNKNSEKHGFFAKWLPEETLDIMDSMKSKSPLDLLWETIQIQYAAIIRSQQIMYVKNKEDTTATKIGFTKGKTIGETWEVEYAWDKQANFLKAQSRAIAELRSNIKSYIELESASKEGAKEQVQDWKAAIIEIAKRRGEAQDGRAD